jgi:DivIVA domain-containing protein
MTLDRDDVLRKDFPITRKGYDPTAVDAHLRKVAKGVDELAKAPPPAPPRDTAGSAAAGKVQAIVEAAERSADEIERQARDDAERTREQAAADAREHVERVAAAAGEMRARIDELESTLSGLLTRFRTEAEVIATDLESLRVHVGEVRAEEEAAPVEAEVVPELAEPLAEPEPEPDPGQAAVEALEEEVAEADTLVAELETTVAEAEAADASKPDPLATLRAAIEKEAANGEAPAAAEEPDELDEVAEEAEAELVEESSETPDAPDEDIEGARIVALGLALKGEPAEKITPQLAKFNLSDPAGLVDDVIAKAGR